MGGVEKPISPTSVAASDHLPLVCPCDEQASGRWQQNWEGNGALTSGSVASSSWRIGEKTPFRNTQCQEVADRIWTQYIKTYMGQPY